MTLAKQEFIKNWNNKTKQVKKQTLQKLETQNITLFKNKVNECWHIVIDVQISLCANAIPHSQSRRITNINPDNEKVFFDADFNLCSECKDIYKLS